MGLSQTVRDLCQYWGLDGGSEEFGLKFDQNEEYVTEASKKNIKDGTILKLCISAKSLAKSIVDKLTSNEEPNFLKGCNVLFSASSDFVVVEQFINFGGLDILIKCLNGTRTLETESSQSQAETDLLGSLVEIMKHDDTPITWDDDRFDQIFVVRIFQNILNFIKLVEKSGVKLPRLKQSLMVLDNLCQSK